MAVPTSQQPATRVPRSLGPFLGIIYALDQRFIPDNAATDLRNVTLEDGRIAPRYGYQNLAGVGSTGITTVQGFDYASGISASGTAIEEYIVIGGSDSSHLLPYKVNPSSGAFTALGTSPGYLANAAYGLQPGFKTFSYNGYSYTIEQSNTSNANVYQHQVGTNASWLQLANPVQPSSGPLRFYGSLLQGFALFKAASGNTGNGTCGTITVTQGTTPNVIAGAYSFVATSATNFTATDPLGNSLAALTVGTTWTHNGLSFKITAGGTAYVASDSFTVTVYLGDNASGPDSLYYNSANVLGQGTAIAASAVTLGGGNLSAIGGVVSNGNYILLNYTTPAGGTYFSNTAVQVDNYDSVTINLAGTHGPGLQDWTFRDRIVVNLYTEGVFFDPKTMQISITTNSGSVFTPSMITPNFNNPGSGAPGIYSFTCDFLGKSPRSNYSAVKSITLAWNTTEVGNAGYTSAGQNYVKIDPILLGGVNIAAQDTSGNPATLLLGYSNYNSTSGLESPLVLCGSVQPGVANGPTSNPLPNLLIPMYGRLKMYLNGSGSDTGFDHYNIYARAGNTNTWYRVDTVPIGPTAQYSGGPGGESTAPNQESLPYGSVIYGGTTYDATYDYMWNWNDVLVQSAITPAGGTFQNVLCGAAFNGGVVWGFKGGQGNMRFSAIGSATTLFNNSDSTQLDPNNIGAPASLTLADSGADDPQAIFAVNSSLIVIGGKGVYASAGTSPNSMSPFKRLPTAPGGAGQFACCKWHDATGNPAVAFLSANGQSIFLAQEDPYFLNTVHYKVTELTEPIRGLVFDFLLGGSLANAVNVRMGVDEIRDALWIVCGTNAMVYRRPSISDQSRHWELYTYTLSSSAIGFLSFTTNWRMRWMRTSGLLDENEWNTAGSAWITGQNSDAGSALSPLPYWQSKVFPGDNRRSDFCKVFRSSTSDQPTISDGGVEAQTRYYVANALPESVQVPSGALGFRFGWLSQGRDHQYTVTLQDGSGAIDRLEVDEIGPLARRVMQGRSSSVGPIWQGPLVITKGGTYSGLYIEGTASTPGITINTNQAVTITNCVINHPGIAIYAPNSGSNLTVSHCTGYGVNPNVNNGLIGNFVKAYKPVSLTVTNCTSTNAGGPAVYVNQANAGCVISILYNWFINLWNTPSNGSGGWTPSGWTANNGHAIQVANAPQAVCEIGWNLVQNTAGASSSDDIINLYQTSGTSGVPIIVHDNFVNGGFAAIPNTQSNAGAAFLSDGDSATAGNECAYIQFNNNYAVNLGIKGGHIAAGHHITFNGHQVYCTGYTPDTLSIYAMNIGIAAANAMSDGTLYHDQLLENSNVYYVRPAHTAQNSTGSDTTGLYYIPDPSTVTTSNNTNWTAGSSSVAALYAAWQAALATAGHTVGA